jgi:hypothetical protein
MTVEYAVRCDGCGRLIATSRLSARAARAEAVIRKGNHGPDGDYCEGCRKKRVTALSREGLSAAITGAHSIGVPHKKSPTCS